MRFRLSVVTLVMAALAVGAQQPEPDLPRFRAGANLVQVDAYISADGVAVTDLRPEDFDLFEDDKPQTIESVELIEARPPVPESERTDPTNTRDMRQQAEEAGRLFTIFLDRMHVSLSGSYHANKPIVETLERLIGPDDLIGVMTPDISPSAVTYSRRTSSIERMITDNWAWGARDRPTQLTPRERMIADCYAGSGGGTTAGLSATAETMIARLREQETLDALDALVTRLEGLRQGRKFVLVFTEGWPLYQYDERLAAPVDGRVPGPDPIGVDPATGGVRRRDAPDPQTGQPRSVEACDRERVMLAFIDHEVEFRELLQRANRANVSFYPIDARGLIVFDQPTRFDLPPSVDNAWLRDRHDDLRMMALQTDGVAVLDTSDVAGAMQRMFADVGSYYLLRYYSSNPKLDGRFRRIRVEVKREHADVRARPGYLAPTEAEARAAGFTPDRPGTSRAAPEPPPVVARALDAIAPGRGNLPVRIQAIGGRASIRAVVELDAATTKQPEWISGGTLQLVITPDRGTGGSAHTVTVPVRPGQRSIPVALTDDSLGPGRYSVRAELTPKAGRLPVQVTTFATVPDAAADIGTGVLALRRGPSTGLAYEPTADPRFRRTERVRVEVPVLAEGYAGSARLLTREGQPMPLVATYTTRVDDETRETLGVAELVLAPLAAGEYVFEVSFEKDGKSESVAFGFRIVP